MLARFGSVGEKNLPAPFEEREKGLGLKHTVWLLQGCVENGLRLGSESSLGSGVSRKSELRARRIRGLKMNNNNNNKQRMVSMQIYYAASYAQIVGILTVAARAFGYLRRIWSLDALGEGSSWDLWVRPVPVPRAASVNLEISEPGHLGIWKPTKSQKNKLSQSKYVLPKMLVRSGLIGANISWPFFRPFQTYSHGQKKCRNDDLFRICSAM